jgi:NADPH-dependent ferric siderophore reductase
VDLVWLHRGSGQIGDQLTKAVTSAKLPAGQVQAFVHGEAHFVRSLRGHLLEECGMDRSWISISGYWRRDADEDAWQATRHEWN